MAINANANSRLFISPTAVIPDTINAMDLATAIAFFEGITDWVEVEEVEDLGTIGDTAEAITFTAIGNARVRKLKGPKDAGTQSVVVGRDPLDDGQEEMIEAEGGAFNYPFRVVLNDAPLPGYANSELFYAGLVMSKATNMGNVSNVHRRNFDIGINTGVYEKLSAAQSAPANILLPSIAGIAQVGQVLTALDGNWSNSPTGYTYQWQEDNVGWANISGATSKTYTPVVGSVGNPLRVIVTAVNGTGTTPATSGATAVVIAA